MAIRVKHAPSAAVLGESAYTIGRGQKRERDTRFATDVRLKEQSLNLRAANIGVRAKYYSNLNKRREEELEFRTERAEESFGLRQDELGFRKQQQQEKMGLRLQLRLDAQKRIRDENTIIDYTPKQKKKLEHYDNLLATALQEYADGKWTTLEMEEIDGKIQRLKDRVIPLAQLRTEMTPGQRWKSGLVTGDDGVQRYQKANGDWERVGPSVKDRAKIYTDMLKSYKLTDGNGNERIDSDAALLEYNKFMTMMSKEDGLATRVAEIKKLRAEQGPQPSAEQKDKTKAAVEALPVMFDTIIKGQPRIGRKKKGKPSMDKVYGEEAYNEMLAEATGRLEQEGVPPEKVKAELDKWWDKQHDKERGQMFQKFGNRMEFEGRKAAPEKREVVPEVDMDKLDKLSLQRIEKFKSGKIVWSAISKKYGYEETEILKYIVKSGNEQSIADALRKMGII